MQRATEVLVVGAGMAGLCAALAAAQAGSRVELLSNGVGSLAISGGSVDLLGAVGGDPVDLPWAAMAMLPPEHPYRLLGRERVAEALAALQACTARQGLPLHNATLDGEPCNTWLPTVMGTLRPSYLVPAALDPEALAGAHRVVVASVEGLRDCQPALVIRQLREQPRWRGRDFVPVKLASPESGSGERSLNALDLARMLDRPEGRNWLVQALLPHVGRADLLLLPPVLGSRADASIWRHVSEALHCPLVEMASIPPGVGGLRLRDALLRELGGYEFGMVENTEILRAESDAGHCRALVAGNVDGESRYEARAFVLATGGILSGGLQLDPGRARESVLGIDIPVPAEVEALSEADIFGPHRFSRLGVTVNGRMQPVQPQDAAGRPLWDNVFFAGRTVGGYDFALEKSGHGVACATGWQAGLCAARLAQEAGKTAGSVMSGVRI